jgi:carboxyl-terminal processing protease
MLNSRRAFHWVLVVVGVLTAVVLGSGGLRDLFANREATYQGLKIFSDVIDIVEKNYVDEVESKTLIENAIQGMVSSLDPHSSLLTPEEFKELQIDTQGEFTGIGIHVTMKDNLVTVISPIEGTPAYKAGIKAGDRIIQVDGTPTEDLREAVKRMRGPKGTPVTLTIVREGETKPIDFKMVRDVIPIYSVKSVLLQPGYGYVWVTHFRDNTYSDLVDALEKLEATKPPLKGLVLDLRDNPGGILDQAIRISDLFLDSGTIMVSKGRLKKHTREYNAGRDDAKTRDYPMVVLINGGSASASEIVAGALQDQQRAVILGTTSFGKGSVQAIENLSDGYALKLTIARYYTPSGRSIQAKGVEPDIVVPLQVLETEKQSTDRMVKEKDLINHLDAEGRGTTSPKESDKTKPAEEAPPARSRIGTFTAEELLTDSQIRRGLDILVGYDIFKKLGHGQKAQ